MIKFGRSGWQQRGPIGGRAAGRDRTSQIARRAADPPWQ